MNVNNFLRDLEHNRLSADKVALPNKSGIYAIFLNEGVQLGEIAEGRDQIIYIGEAKNLSQRQHFNAKDSGFSTLRRSLGAILKEELNLKAIKRGSGSGKNTFKFNSESEKLISAWMNENLEISFIPVLDRYKELERELVNLAEPVLNIIHWDNPMNDKIAVLRDICKDEAQAK